MGRGRCSSSFELSSKLLFSLNRWKRTSETIIISHKSVNSERFEPNSRIQLQVEAILSDLELEFMRQEAAIEEVTRKEQEAREDKERAMEKRQADALQVCNFELLII